MKNVYHWLEVKLVKRQGEKWEKELESSLVECLDELRGLMSGFLKVAESVMLSERGLGSKVKEPLLVD